MSTEKLALVLKLSKLFRVHSADPDLFKSLFIASIIPLITEFVQHNDTNSISKILLQLCKNPLLSPNSIQTSLDIAHELIKKHNNPKDEIETKEENTDDNHNETENENNNKSILCIDDISQIPVNILSNVFTFISIKELLTSTQFVSHQFIYGVRQPLVIHTMSHWLSHKIISFMTAKPDIKDNNTNYPLPSFYKLSQSVKHLSLQYNHTKDVFTDLMLFKMNFIPILSQLKSIYIHDDSLWNHQPIGTSSITEILRYIEPKNKLQFTYIWLNNIRIDYALINYISTNFNLKKLIISTQGRSIFKNIYQNNINIDIHLFEKIDDIYCELIPSKVIIISNEHQYMALLKLRLSKFLQFIIHVKLKKLELNIKLLRMNEVFDEEKFGMMNVLNDLTLHLHEDVTCYAWCSKLLNRTGALHCFSLVCNNIINASKSAFQNVLETVWNKNKKSMSKISFKMKWNANIINDGYCRLFGIFDSFWRCVMKSNYKALRFDIYIDCANTVPIALFNQLIDFAKWLKEYDALSLVINIGCFDDGINEYLSLKQKELSLFEKIDSLPSDYLSKTVIRAQMR